MSQPNETQLTEAPVPWAPKPRDRRALSAYRHGLTGQIQLFTDADRAAYEKHCQGYHQSLAPPRPRRNRLSAGRGRRPLAPKTCRKSGIGDFCRRNQPARRSHFRQRRSGHRPGASSRLDIERRQPAAPRIVRKPHPASLRKEHGGDPNPPGRSQGVIGASLGRGRPALPTRREQRRTSRAIAIHFGRQV
jgi:hypothetical protein